MTENSYFWGGTELGDASLAPIDASEFSEILRRMFCIDTLNGYTTGTSDDGWVSGENIQTGAVISGYLNELEVTNPAGTTIEVASGAAIVGGRLYLNTAVVTLAVAIPVLPAPQGYVVYLKHDATAQTVRIGITGPVPGDPSPDPPVNTIDVNYTVLAKVACYPGGAGIHLLDERRFLRANCNQAPILFARQGGSASLLNVGGANNYELDETAEVIVGSCKHTGSPYTYGVIHVILTTLLRPIGTSYPVLIVTPQGNNPVIRYSVYFQETGSVSFGYIFWTSTDGSNQQPAFDFIAFYASSDKYADAYNTYRVVQAE